MEARLRLKKDQLRDLYIVENKTLNAVMQDMETRHQIVANQSVYTRLFREWNFQKNQKDQVWNYADHRLAKRKNEGKLSNVYVNGTLQAPEKIRKEIARHVTTLQQLARNSAPSPRTPEGWSIVTPRPYTASEASVPSTPSASDEVMMTTQDPEAVEQAAEDTEETFGETAIDIMPHEEADFHILAEVMQKCGTFISLWGQEERSMKRTRLLSLYDDVARNVILAARLLEDTSYTEQTVYATGVDILAKALRNASDLTIDPERRVNPIIGDVMRAAFYVAARKGHCSAVGSLISCGVNVNSRDSEGVYPLHVAAEYNHPELVALLLEQGAQVNSKSHDGHTAWTRICEKSSHEAIAQILVSHNVEKNVHFRDGENVLYQAASGGHVEQVRTMLRRGMSPSFATPYRWCPLHFSAANGHLEVVKLLIEAGAEVNSISDQSKTPLDLANSGKNNAETISYLVDHGALTARQKRSLQSMGPPATNMRASLQPIIPSKRPRSTTPSSPLAQHAFTVPSKRLKTTPSSPLVQPSQDQENAHSSFERAMMQILPRLSPKVSAHLLAHGRSSSLNFQPMSTLWMHGTSEATSSKLSFWPMDANHTSSHEDEAIALENLEDEGYGSPNVHPETPQSLSMPSPVW